MWGVHKIVLTFGLESCRIEMKEEMNRINQDLLQIKRDRDKRERESSKIVDNKDVAEITESIRLWLKSAVEKFTKYEAQHSKLLKEAVKGVQKQWLSHFGGLTTTIDNEEFMRVKE